MQGQGVVRVEGEDVGPGDAVLVPPSVDHGLSNTSSETLRLLIIWGNPQSLNQR